MTKSISKFSAYVTEHHLYCIHYTPSICYGHKANLCMACMCMCLVCVCVCACVSVARLCVCACMFYQLVCIIILLYVCVRVDSRAIVMHCYNLDCIV